MIAMEYEEIDLTGKTEEEIFKAYVAVANDIEIQKNIWNETKDLKLATAMYNKYLEKKKEKNNNDNINGEMHE